MKGISAVIATILMLMITVAMVGLAYMFITGLFTSSTATNIALSSVDCTGGNIYVTIRNTGTESISVADITVYVDDTGTVCGGGTMTSGNATACTTIASPGAGSHSLRILGPSNSVTGTVYCAS